jgi:hypothetical protein
VVEIPQRPKPRNAAEMRRILWALLVVAWIAVLAWGVYTFRQHQGTPGLPTLANMPLTPVGTWETVLNSEMPVPLTLSLGHGHEIRAVRIGGLAEPKDDAEAARIAARLKELVPANSEVYVQMEPRAADDARQPPIATILIPPPGASHAEPFPFDKSKMLGATLIEEGLARVDMEELYRYRTEFEERQFEAKRHALGIWAQAAEATATATP